MAAASALCLLIATSTDGACSEVIPLREALAQALQRNADTLVLEQNLRGAEARLLSARGRFDPVVSADAGRFRDETPLRADQRGALALVAGDPSGEQRLDRTRFGVGMSKKLRNGAEIAGTFAMDAYQDSVEKAFGVPDQVAGELGFVIRMPLARNAGRMAAGAEVDAADADLAAVRADTVHGNAVTVLETTRAYWQWLAGERQLAVARRAEQRLDELVGEIERLIVAGELPRADAELALASRAERRSQRLGVEQAATESRLALAILLGASDGDAVGVPADDFPVRRELAPGIQASRLAEIARSERGDLEAARRRAAATAIRLTAARNQLLPQVDITLNMTWRGLEEGVVPSDIGASLNHLAGPGVGIAVSAELPLRNRSARGAHQLALSEREIAHIRLHEIERQIDGSVAVALAGLRRAGARLAEVEEAVRRYTTTLGNEQTKRRLGTATLIDVIDVEDRLNGALLARIDLQAAYAEAIVRLEFETGQLVRPEGDGFSVDLDALLGRKDGGI